MFRTWTPRVARTGKYILLGTVGVGALALSPSLSGHVAQAQEADIFLEEITVTARRREESLQDTPVAVTAFGAGAIEARHIQSVADINQYVPNLQFDSVASESGGGMSSQISIRGIGQTDYTITVEPGVGLYLDGVYIGKSVGSLMDAVDLESIEVLRGPQGTLFGKNTIGGAILLTSKRPGPDPEFMFDVTTGRYERLDIKTMVNAPINEKLRVRFSGAVLTRGGHVERVLTGDRQGNKNALNGRIVAELDVTDRLRATFAVDGTRAREQSPGQVILDINENAFFAGLHNTIAFPACDPAGSDARLSNPDCANAQYVRPLKDRESTNTGPNQSDTDIWGTQLTLDWDGDDIALKSISAFRQASVEILQELTGIPAYRNDIGSDITLKQYTQEFQVSGQAVDSRLNYLFGVFYMKEKGSQVFPVLLSPVEFTAGGSIDNDSYAGFGQIGYDLTDALSLTVGARYSHEKKRFQPEQQIDHVPDIYAPFWDAFADITGGGFLVEEGLPLFPRVWASRSDKEFTPSVSLDYRVTEDAMVYASYSKGFKGGGFTMRGFPPVIPGVTTPETDPQALIPSFGPETAEVFEVGLKSELFDRRVRLNLAAFITNYDDVQLLANTGLSAFVPVLINAGDARIKGVEAETEILVTEWLRFNGGVGYLDSNYRSLSEQAIGAGASLDSELPNSPKWTATAGATVDLMNTDSGRLFARGDLAYKGGHFKTVANDAPLRQSSYALVNASLTYEHGENWQATLGATNLTNKAYIISGVANAGIGYAQGIVSRPREWFLNVKYRY